MDTGQIKHISKWKSNVLYNQEGKVQENSRDRWKKWWEKYISMQPAQNCLKLIHCLYYSLSSQFFRSEAESPPCPRRLGRRAPLQIFSCCSAALRRTQRPHSDQALKAIADIILGGFVQGKPPHSAMQTTAFISGGRKKLGITRPQSRVKLAAEGWQGEVAQILRHYRVWIGRSDILLSVWNSREGRFLHSSATPVDLFHDRMGQRRQRGGKRTKYQQHCSWNS